MFFILIYNKYSNSPLLHENIPIITTYRTDVQNMIPFVYQNKYKKGEKV